MFFKALLEYSIFNEGNILEDLINKIKSIVKLRMFDNNLTIDVSYLVIGLKIIKKRNNFEDYRWALSILCDTERQMNVICQKPIINIIKSFVEKHCKDQRFNSYFHYDAKKNHYYDFRCIPKGSRE